MPTCAKDGCDFPTSGKSKYCGDHKREARAAWKQMITEKAGDKAAREEKFHVAVAKAHAAGLVAAEACKPTPMVVQQHANMLDDNSPVVKEYFVAGGPCGFAWVKIGPGNHPFANWLKKNKLAHKSYYGGVEISAGLVGGQSMQIKEAYVRAYADKLKAELDDPKLSIHTSSRMD